ncbi:hypothetical protein EV182_003632 [Spiromyces aspiralis]|uniref:Uncharacterized protein n=1 Tax=Spiromyces aspiralis TaxID=68401 RepID=A0ACC1HF62_9FUNG|nr:hypothetical protein EV182_003632 [Spiromyces aspiralis]
MTSATGTNNVPLGTRNRQFGVEHVESQVESALYDVPPSLQSRPGPEPRILLDPAVSSALAKAQALANSVLGGTPSTTSSSTGKEGDSPATADDSTADLSERRRRRRKNRWGTADVKTQGVVTALPSGMDKQQMEWYAAQLRIDEITAKLRSGDVVPADRDRSPSPPPVYDREGKRINTREYRYRKKLEQERNGLIDKLIRTNPDYKPPSDYKRSTTITEKLYIPAKEYPHINFIGLLLGPRGNTLKEIQEDSGTRVSIRGKGSVKEGKSQRDTASSEDELHCLIMADTQEKIEKAKKRIQYVIDKACTTPEGHNELKRNQLRQLAALNGTLRDDENQTCLNCGAVGHMRWDCPEAVNVTNRTQCRICRGMGHIARDCTKRFDSEFMERNKQVNSEYLNLMAELGGGDRAADGTPKLLTGGNGGADDEGDGESSVRSGRRHNRPGLGYGDEDHYEMPADPGTPPWRQYRKNRGRQHPPPMDLPDQSDAGVPPPPPDSNQPPPPPSPPSSPSDLSIPPPPPSLPPPPPPPSDQEYIPPPPPPSDGYHNVPPPPY